MIYDSYSLIGDTRDLAEEASLSHKISKFLGARKLKKTTLDAVRTSKHILDLCRERLPSRIAALDRARNHRTAGVEREVDPSLDTGPVRVFPERIGRSRWLRPDDIPECDSIPAFKGGPVGSFSNGGGGVIRGDPISLAGSCQDV